MSTQPPAYRFESLLKLREAEKSEKKNAFAAAQNRLAEAEARLAAVDAQLSDALDEAKRRRADSTFDAATVKSRLTYRSALLNRREAARAEIARRTAEVESARAELDEAVKNVKILQKLKEKSEESANAELLKRAEKEMNELASRQKLETRRRSSR